MRISFIGAGVMGEAMIAGILRTGVAQPQYVTAADPVAQRRRELAERYGIATTDSNRHAVAGADVAVLAVKPQQLSDVLSELAGATGRDQTIVSIVAGARLGTLMHTLGHHRVVRVMSNTPAQIGAGMTVWTATFAVTAEQREQVRSILSALGRELYVDDEKYIDMATAVSASGPAYIFLVLEALTDAGVHIGLTRAMAAELALQTLLGAARYAEATGRHPAELRNEVTSPGGTTVEGLRALEEGALRARFVEAVVAAYQKAKSLGG